MTVTNASSLSKRWFALELIILGAALAISAALILKGEGTVPSPPMDQRFVDTVDLQIQRINGHWKFQYPNLQYAGGTTSSLAAGLYKLIIPTTHANLN